MSRYVITPNLFANGNILPASFVKLDPSNDLYGLQAGAGDQVVTVAGTDVNGFPDAVTGSTNHATAGQPITGYGPGQYVPVKAGTAGYSRGWIKPDSTGLAISANPGDVGCAYAYMTAAAGEIRNVLFTGPVVVPGGPASSAGVIAATTATNLSSSQSGSIVEVGVANAVVTLPPVATSKGFRVKVIQTAATATLTGATTPTVIAVNAADVATVKTFGTGLTAVAGKGIQDTKTTATQGDSAELVCDGSNWYATWFGTWIAQP